MRVLREKHGEKTKSQKLTVEIYSWSSFMRPIDYEAEGVKMPLNVNALEQLFPAPSLNGSGSHSMGHSENYFYLQLYE